MKKIIIATIGAVALVFLLAPRTTAQATKVDVCHLNSANDVLDLGWLGSYVFGKQINVAEKALPAHLDHGDATRFWSLDSPVGQWVVGILEALGLKLPNADCVFRG
jgi:hypothetical protein